MFEEGRITSYDTAICVDEKVDIIRKSMINLEEALSKDGILQWKLLTYQKQQLKNYHIPSAYCDTWLENNHKIINAIECDLTFWAVQFYSIINLTN